jgi:hypothetical protein
VSKYLLNKFLYTIDRDPDLVERYRHDHEREALATHDYARPLDLAVPRHLDLAARA